jgi:hypothetical protein
MAQVNQKAMEIVMQTLKGKLEELHAKRNQNKRALSSLMKEQRSLKAASGEMFKLLREIEGKEKKVFKKHQKQ